MLEIPFHEYIQLHPKFTQPEPDKFRAIELPGEHGPRRTPSRQRRLWEGFANLLPVPNWDHNSAVKIVSIKMLRRFWEDFPDSEQQLKAWVDEARNADWKQPADIKEKFRGASILKNRRVVFTVKGNDYRLVVFVAYRFQSVYIKFIGTRAQYDAIDAETVELED